MKGILDCLKGFDFLNQTDVRGAYDLTGEEIHGRGAYDLTGEEIHGRGAYSLTDERPIMTNFTTSPPRALTGKEFIDAINDFFNKINTLNTLEGIRHPLCDNVASITTAVYRTRDDEKCYLIWAQGLLYGYDRTRDSNECFKMNSLFFVNRVKDENGIMRWRIVDKLEEKGLPSPYSAFKQLSNSGYYCAFYND